MMGERKNVDLVTDEMICRHRNYSREEERNRAMVEKYLRDVRKFREYLCLSGGDELGGKEAGEYGSDKRVVLEYKQYLNEHYKTISMNSMLTAVDSFLEYLGCGEYKVKLLEVQHVQFSEPEKELAEKDYRRLVQAAERKKNVRMSMLFQTIRSTGIRINELRFTTVESLGHGWVGIYNKGRSGTILLPAELVRVLIKYYQKIGITGGSISITRSGKPIDWSNISKKMKGMSRKAGVDERRVFPHNFRHLFVRTFYWIEKGVIRLMGSLGHSGINTMRIYATNTEEQLGRQVSRMWLVPD